MSGAQEAAGVAGEEVARALREVLARPEFAAREGWGEALARWLAEHLHLSLSRTAAEGLLWGLVIGAALGLALFLARFVGAGRARTLRAAPDEAAGPSLAERVEALRAEARAARARGETSLALRLSFHALVLAMGGHGALEFRPSWTNRELLRRGRPSAEALALLAPLVGELEAKEYGGAPASEADLERLDALCAHFLGARQEAA